MVIYITRADLVTLQIVFSAMAILLANPLIIDGARGEPRCLSNVLNDLTPMFLLSVVDSGVMLVEVSLSRTELID